MLTELMVRNNLPSKTVRRLVKEIKSYQDPFSAPDLHGNSNRNIHRILNKCILLLKTTLIRLDDIIQHLDEDNWVTREALLTDRTMIHEQIDVLLRLRMKLNRADYVKAF